MRIEADHIFDRVCQEDLFRYYLNRDPDHSGLHTNPLRKDLNPGCGFFVDYKGKLIFYDHAAKEGYDIFKVLKEKYNLSFREAYFRIDKDFNLGLTGDTPKEKIKVESKPSERKLIQVVQKRFTKEELKFWEDFGISYATLQLFGVMSIKNVYINKSLSYTSSKKMMIFAWVFPDSGHTKVYIPSLTGEKSIWVSNCSLEDIQGERMLPFLGELAIITKSLKDIMLLHELGYPSVAPQSEGAKVREGYIESLKSTFDRIVILYDNDGEFYPPKGISGKGKEAAIKLSTEYDIPFVFIPEGEPKDISDYYKKYGGDKTIELLKRLLYDKI